MNTVRTIFREIFGLFVDDGFFALSILIWLGLTALLLPHLGWVPRWSGGILFGGLSAILVWSSIRYAREGHR